jgi:uncharacterized protein YukE
MGLLSGVVDAVEEAGSAVHRTVHDVAPEMLRGVAHAGPQAGLVGAEIQVARDVAQAPADVERALLDKVLGVSSGELEGYAARLGSLAEQVESLDSKIRAALANSSWTGSAATAFTVVGERRIAQLRSLASDLESAAASVHTLALAF